MNGASASRARRRAISVFPTPVGPIIRMFFGVISWRSGSATCCLRQRLRSAIATARFARSWPTMCLSSSCTISCGGMLLIGSLQHFDRALLVRQLRLETFEERECICGAARESGQDAIVIEPPDFPRARLDHHLPERDLAVAAERHARSAAYR